MTPQQRKDVRELFLATIRPDFKGCASFFIRYGLLTDAKICKFLAVHFYRIEIEATRANGGYGDKKQALHRVQQRVPLSIRRIQTLIK